MFYTSYFGNLKNIPKDLVPIAICGKSPAWYTGLEYKKLAPSWSIFSEWKYQHHDDGIYTARYKSEILNKLNPTVVVHDILKLTDGKDACLLCYEIPIEFCHRHLVADWLTENKYPTMELNNKTFCISHIFPTR